MHCKTETEAKQLKAVIGERLKQCKLELHAEKTKIIYCKDDRRRGSYSDEKFDFLGFTCFRLCFLGFPLFISLAIDKYH